MVRFCFARHITNNFSPLNAALCSRGVKLEKLIFSILSILIFLGFWVVEPFANNPFHELESPLIQSSGSYSCTSNSLGVTTESDSVLKKYMSSGDFLGVSTGLLKEGCGSYILSSGYGDKRNLTKLQPNTITRIASITKPMTAIAIMQLHEKGKVDLDVPIQTYIPDFPSSEQAVTIRHILSHTSGIPHYNSKVDAMSFSHYDTLESATKAVFENGLTSPTGEKYVYSSFGYTVLGRVIEVVSNARFEEYLKKNIWQKAGMENTSLETSHSISNKSRLYIKVGKIYLRSPYNDLSIIYPAGGVQSTTEELLKFGQAILNNELISRDTLEMMIDVRDSLAPEAGDNPYGLGWSVYESPDNGRIISHGGSQPGVSAHFQILLDKGIVSVAISNVFGTKSSAYELATKMGHLVI